MIGDIGPFLPFVLATAISSVVAVTGYLAARRAGLGPVQSQYVEALKGSNAAMKDRIDLIEEALGREKDARARLAKKVVRLERTVISLAEENDRLRTRLKMPRRLEDPALLLATLNLEGDEDLLDPELGNE